VRELLTHGCALLAQLPILVNQIFEVVKGYVGVLWAPQQEEEEESRVSLLNQQWSPEVAAS